MSMQNTHDQLHTEKYIPVVKANSVKGQNEQRSVFQGRKHGQSWAMRLGPGTVVSDQPDYSLRSRGQEDTTLQLSSCGPAGPPGFGTSVEWPIPSKAPLGSRLSCDSEAQEGWFCLHLWLS